MERKSRIDAWNKLNGNTLSGTAAWNGSLEQMHGTEMERKYFVWNSCMEQKSGTDAWNRAGTEILSLEQLHGTVVWNSCMERKYFGTDAWNRAGTEICKHRCTEHGTEVELDIPPRAEWRLY